MSHSIPWFSAVFRSVAFLDATWMRHEGGKFRGLFRALARGHRTCYFVVIARYVCFPVPFSPDPGFVPGFFVAEKEKRRNHE